MITWSDVVCSTPEGIGGGISVRGAYSVCRCFLCSTPEGIGGGIRLSVRNMSDALVGGAQRPKASEGESDGACDQNGPCEKECSTPEGIGGGIRRCVRQITSIWGHVLNARRHRRGNQKRTTNSSRS